MKLITRRQFLQWVTASAAALGLSQTDLLKLKEVLAAPQTGCLSPTPSVIWMIGQACSGCQTSLLNRVVQTDGNYYDRDMLNALYNLGLSKPTASDPIGLELNVVNDVADLLVGDAVKALVPALVRDLPWAPFPNGYVTLEWLTTVMAGAGDIPVQHLKSIVNAGGFVLLVDGAIPTGNSTSKLGSAINNEDYCFVFDNICYDGTKAIDGLTLGASVTMADAMRWMAPQAAAIISVGTCSSYGGIPAAKGNKTGAGGLKDFLTAENITTPVINVPGCPPHPDWVVYPVAYYLIHSAVCTLDDYGRPKAVYGNSDQVFCEKCANRGTTSASKLGDDGCTSQVGCKGPATYGDCPARMKNVYDDGTKNNWCAAGSPGPSIAQARHVCQGCIMPDFPDGKSPFYKKIV
jgi:hydrogenase small subunit